MSTATVLESYRRNYNPHVITYGGYCMDTKLIDMCVINNHSCAEELWRYLAHNLPKMSSSGVLFIPVYNELSTRSPLPYELVITNLVKAYAPHLCSTILGTGNGSNLIILSNIKNPTKVPVSAFYVFSDLVSPILPVSDSYITSLNITPDKDVQWVSDNISTKPANGPVDVVFTLAGASSQTDNEELRLALRSIAANAQNLGNVWIITDNPPKWLTGVNIISVPDTFTNNKDANLITKILAACDNPDVSDRFIYWSDDQILSKPLDLSQHLPIYNPRNILKFAPDGKKWVRRMRNTMNYIHKNGGDCSVNWDSHVPQPIDKHEFKRVISNTPYTELPGFCINTLYFGLKGEDIRNHQDDFKYTYESDKPGTIKFDKQFIGYNDSGYDNGVRDALLYKFQDPCKYEKNT